MSDDLAKRIEECLEQCDGVGSADLLEKHGAEITDPYQLETMVGYALNRDSDNASRFYASVIGRVRAELAQRLNAAIGEHSKYTELYRILRDDASAPHHTAILDACDLEDSFSNDLVSMLIEAGDKLSKENRIRVAKTIVSEEEWEGEDPGDEKPAPDEIVEAMYTLRSVLDDDALASIGLKLTTLRESE